MDVEKATHQDEWAEWGKGDDEPKPKFAHPDGFVKTELDLDDFDAFPDALKKCVTDEPVVPLHKMFNAAELKRIRAAFDRLALHLEEFQHCDFLPADILFDKLSPPGWDEKAWGEKVKALCLHDGVIRHHLQIKVGNYQGEQNLLMFRPHPSWRAYFPKTEYGEHSNPIMRALGRQAADWKKMIQKAGIKSDDEAYTFLREKLGMPYFPCFTCHELAALFAESEQKFGWNKAKVQRALNLALELYEKPLQFKTFDVDKDPVPDDQKVNVDHDEFYYKFLIKGRSNIMEGLQHLSEWKEATEASLDSQLKALQQGGGSWAQYADPAIGGNGASASASQSGNA